MFPSRFVRISLFNHGSTEKLTKIRNPYVRRFLVLAKSAGWGLTHLRYFIRREVYFPKFELLLSRGCPFDCKCCIHFISDYIDAACEPAESVIEDMKKLLAAVERIDEVDISGGDAFLYPQLAEVVQYLLTSDKIGKVMVVATGAVSPEPAVIRLLENKKLELKIDNYGSYSSKLSEYQELQYPNVKYSCLYDEWSDFGNETSRNRSEEELNIQYGICMPERYCLLNGKIYPCPRSAHGENLGYFTCGENESVDLRHTEDSRQLLTAIKKLRAAKHLTACNHCNSCTADFKTYNIKDRFRDGGSR